MFKIKSKKASASAITWVPATFLIVFIMLVHLMFSGILRVWSGDRVNIGLEDKKSNLRIDDLESFMAFLNTPISEEYSGVEAARAGRHGVFLNSEEIKKAVKLRDKISPATLLIGNGDVKNYNNGIELSKN